MAGRAGRQASEGKSIMCRLIPSRQFGRRQESWGSCRLPRQMVVGFLTNWSRWRHHWCCQFQVSGVWFTTFRSVPWICMKEGTYRSAANFCTWDLSLIKTDRTLSKRDSGTLAPKCTDSIHSFKSTRSIWTLWKPTQTAVYWLWTKREEWNLGPLGPICCVRGHKSSLVIGQSVEISPNPLTSRSWGIELLWWN